MPLSYLDCSIVLKCCPCPDFSFRQFLKSCCCDSEKLRRNVNCECMRPAVHGSQRSEGLNLSSSGQFSCEQLAKWPKHEEKQSHYVIWNGKA
uniref:Uncharacterized protein n=1 Tax=Setaria digitata TaxID=48799 RepID=A0A915PJS5_9BILA